MHTTNPFDSLADAGCTRTRKVAALLGVTPATVYSWAKKGLLPPIVRIGPNTSAMVNADLKAAGKRMIAEAA